MREIQTSNSHFIRHSIQPDETFKSGFIAPKLIIQAVEPLLEPNSKINYSCG